MKYYLCLFIFLTFSIPVTAVSGQSEQFQTIKVNGFETNLSIFSIFVAPKSIVSIKTKRKEKNLFFTFENKKVAQKVARHWSFTAPENPGLYKLKGRNSANGTSIKINVFVTVPYSRRMNGTLEGYRVGEYPPPKTIKSAKYSRPLGFIRVDRKNKDTLLTPHFKLSQFLCKQKSGYPKFLIIKENLLLLLEDLLARVRQEGYDIDTFGFISGYRTPFYNKKLRNVRYSRHVYGDAADIYIDSNINGKMDDLNRDGKVNISDVRIFYNIAVDLKKSQLANSYTGGIGLYKKTSHHDGFIHVDTRGYPARWE